MASEIDESRARKASSTCSPPRASAGTPLYVHLPFCAAKCHYCDFFSVPDAGHDVDAMVDAILREACARAPRRPKTLYLGGGTPSLLSIGQLSRLLNGLQKLTEFRASAVEVTAECNPESLTRDKARALLDLGVTRLSIGFQSLHADVLALFGRVHSVDDSFRAFDAARAAGVEHLNVDLIFAAPGQTPESWRADLARIVALQPDHVSAYNLTFEEETLFQRWLEQGRVARAPEELELELFHATHAALAAASFHAYEISNFARSGERCLHNVNYWRNGEYLGVGPSAVSKVGLERAGNSRSIFDYRKRIAAASEARVWSESLPPLARLAETWWLGLRLLEGLRPADALARSATALDDFDGLDPTAPTVTRLVELGLLERNGDVVRLSASGLPVADAVAREFLTLAATGGSDTRPTQPHRIAQ